MKTTFFFISLFLLSSTACDRQVQERQEEAREKQDDQRDDSLERERDKKSLLHGKDDIKPFEKHYNFGP